MPLHSPEHENKKCYKAQSAIKHKCYEALEYLSIIKHITTLPYEKKLRSSPPSETWKQKSAIKHKCYEECKTLWLVKTLIAFHLIWN